jgi:hypothetical protein
MPMGRPNQRCVKFAVDRRLNVLLGDGSSVALRAICAFRRSIPKGLPYVLDGHKIPGRLQNDGKASPTPDAHRRAQAAACWAGGQRG